MAYKTEPVEAGTIQSEDIIIALMGLTGSGKSQIIDSLTGQNTRAAKSLKTCADGVSAYRVLDHEKYGNRLVLVDTPGFDATHKTDRQILEMISKWMTKTYKRRVTLTAIFYVHRITDLQVSGTAHHNLCMFAELCGDKSARNVMLVTTMWDNVKDIPAAEKKEANLKERYWNVMIHHGASVGRFHKIGTGPNSPWEMVDKMVRQHQLGQALLLQQEMVDEGKRLEQTNAGKALSSNLRILLIKQKRLLEGERADADVEGDSEMAALRAEIEKEFEHMKTPLGRRIALLFGRAFGNAKKEQAAAITVAN
ncbi:hypothetical protein M413DRAFT_440534 [Hebeloma cylindrosporum]|uniref:G domain-containing protein n=1 Tax=Hebeloma cylindrosporum TaxID=76867 RepID=A0A0C2Z1B9_HEBCY|nr:hypothetical protein M413DRAFT_440534 [Hebeloma cylindrosporum h7]